MAGELLLLEDLACVLPMLLLLLLLELVLEEDEDEVTENTWVTLSMTEPLMMLPIDRCPPPVEAGGDEAAGLGCSAAAAGFSLLLPPP